MNITVEQRQGRVPVAVMRLEGDLDGSNYLEVIAQAREIHQAGGRYILIDMAGVGFMGSAGLVALHQTAMVMQNQETPDTEQGWAALHAIRDSALSIQPYVKILSPQPSVDRSLARTGMHEFFEIHTDLATAIASF